MKVYEDRREIPEEYKWNLEKVFANEEEFETLCVEIEKLLTRVAGFKGRILESKSTFKEFLTLRDEIFCKLDTVAVYAHMKFDENTKVSSSQAMNMRARRLSVKVDAEFSFMDTELLSADETQINEYLEDDGLKLYKQFIRTIFDSKEHVLSDSEEKIIAQMGDVLYSSANTFSVLNNADMTFPSVTGSDGVEHRITHGSFVPLMENRDRNLRKDTFDIFYDRYKSFENTFTSTLDGNVKALKTVADIRGFKSAREMALSRNNIPETVYDNLINSVHNYLPHLHKYMGLRKKILGLEDLHMYDIYTPLVEQSDETYSFEDAREMIKSALKVLGDDYSKIVDEGFSSRWMDVYENVGKRSGAYSSGCYTTMPYILLNYQGTLDNVFTVAHELGHSIHSYYSRDNQEYIYSGYSIFLAEIASTCNEALLLDYLIKNAKDAKTKKSLLVHYLESFRGTVFRQTMFAEFEHTIKSYVENGGALTAEYLNKTYYDLNVKFYGSEMTVDKKIESEWARIPHFYYEYYVYQYATGFSAAQAFSKRILSGDVGEIEKYINFLKAGCSEYPIDVLKRAGLDMTSEEPVNLALDKFASLVSELENLI